MSRDEHGPPTASASRPRGRPPVWASAAARRQAHTRRRSERERLLRDLLQAVRNARWEDPAVQRLIREGDDPAVLRALTDYYRQRHWMRPAPAVTDRTAEAGTDRSPTHGGSVPHA